jgi:hypothetical protein
VTDAVAVGFCTFFLVRRPSIERIYIVPRDKPFVKGLFGIAEIQNLYGCIRSGFGSFASRQ